MLRQQARKKKNTPKATKTRSMISNGVIDDKCSINFAALY
jgi:hypothetical protein